MTKGNNGYCTDYDCSLRNSNGYCTITGCVKTQTVNYGNDFRIVEYVEISDECIERIADAVVRKLMEVGDDRR